MQRQQDTRRDCFRLHQRRCRHQRSWLMRNTPCVLSHSIIMDSFVSSKRRKLQRLMLESKPIVVCDGVSLHEVLHHLWFMFMCNQLKSTMLEKSRTFYFLMYTDVSVICFPLFFWNVLEDCNIIK